MNKTIVTPPTSLATSALQILLESLPSGQFAAWALALPDCRVVADSRDGAIEALEARLQERRGTIEVIELPGLVATPEEHPVMQFAGIFKDDPDFAEIVAAMRAERELEADNPAYTMDW